MTQAKKAYVRPAVVHDGPAALTDAELAKLRAWWSDRDVCHSDRQRADMMAVLATLDAARAEVERLRGVIAFNATLSRSSIGPAAVRDEAFEEAACIVDQYGTTDIAYRIRKLKVSP